jgi:hypothetical protein
MIETGKPHHYLIVLPLFARQSGMYISYPFGQATSCTEGEAVKVTREAAVATFCKLKQ